MTLSINLQVEIAHGQLFCKQPTGALGHRQLMSSSR
jgi:hypothetical protein